jgi:hypothetical protein
MPGLAGFKLPMTGCSQQEDFCHVTDFFTFCGAMHHQQAILPAALKIAAAENRPFLLQQPYSFFLSLRSSYATFQCVTNL